MLWLCWPRRQLQPRVARARTLCQLSPDKGDLWNVKSKRYLPPTDCWDRSLQAALGRKSGRVLGLRAGRFAWSIREGRESSLMCGCLNLVSLYTVESQATPLLQLSFSWHESFGHLFWIIHLIHEYLYCSRISPTPQDALFLPFPRIRSSIVCCVPY